MASKFVLVVNTNNDAATTASEIAPNVAANAHTTGADAGNTIRSIAAFLETQVNGRGINVVYFDTAVSASTTGTFTGDPTAADTITVNGVVFTARASGAAANEFNIGGTPTLNATNLAAAINASVSTGIVGTVGASSSLGVVTFFAIVPGSAGLNIPITESLDQFTLAAVTFSTGGTQAHTSTLSAGL